MRSMIAFLRENSFNRHGAALAPVLIVTAILTFVGTSDSLTNGYSRYLLALTAVYAVVVLCLSYLAGLAKLFSFGHTGFLALGAYLMAALGDAGLPVEVSLLIVAVAGGTLGLMLGGLAPRLPVLYFAIVTFAFGLSVEEIIRGLEAVTGGVRGRSVPAMSSLFGSVDDRAVIVVSLWFAAAVFIAAGALSRGRGRRWLALKDQRIPAATVGINARLELAVAFALGAVPTAIAGGLMALLNGFLLPESFTFHFSLYLVAAAILGGLGSRVGAYLGAAFLVFAPELIRGLGGASAENVGNVQLIVFGMSIILVLLFLPQGVAPGLRRLASRLVLAARARGQSGTPSEVSTSTVDAEALLPFVRPPSGSLDVSSCTVHFGGVTALQGVDVSVPPGAVVGLIGPNGAGKTTFLNVLSGVVAPSGSSGSLIAFQGVDLLDAPPHRRAQVGIARTFQHAEVFPELTVRENLEVAARSFEGGIRSRSARVARREADTLTEALGLQAWSETPGSELPFAVRTLVDLGRALATRPALIVMDEPFAGLDRNEIAHMRSVIQSLKDTKTSVLLIDHVIAEVLALADTVVALDFGTVLATGTPEEVRQNRDVIHAYLGTDDDHAYLGTDDDQADPGTEDDVHSAKIPR